LVADSGGAATVIVDSTATSVFATTGLEAKISDGLTTRLSYTVDYNSNPPAGAVSTDTLTRFTLVYGF
jgi:putative salt-induced outer membrane protein